MHNQFAQDISRDSELTPPTHLPNDQFEPANERGDSDLNLHLLDMQADPDPSKDPYAKAGA